MRLQQLSQNEDNRQIMAAGVGAAIIGGSAIIPAVLDGAAKGFGLESAVGIVAGLIFLCLAVGIHLHSRASAAAALGLFVALRLLAAWSLGPMALGGIWFAIGFAVLGGGVHATFEGHQARTTTRA
jgi:hypothetical protein